MASPAVRHGPDSSERPQHQAHGRSQKEVVSRAGDSHPPFLVLGHRGHLCPGPGLRPRSMASQPLLPHLNPQMLLTICLHSTPHCPLPTLAAHSGVPSCRSSQASVHLPCQAFWELWHPPPPTLGYGRTCSSTVRIQCCSPRKTSVSSRYTC